MSFATAFDMTRDGGFAQRVTAGVVKVAIDVAAEDIGTPNHADRAALANKVLLEPERWGATMIFGVTANVALQEAYENGKLGGVDDGSIEFTIASVWDGYAVVTKGKE